MPRAGIWLQRTGAFAGSMWGPLVLTLVLGLPRLRFPIGDDAAVFANAAQTILDGGALYRDIWFNGLPLNPLLFAALGNIVHLSAATPHIIHLLESLGGVALVYFAGNRALGRKHGVFGAYIFGLVSMLSITFDVVAEPEFLAGLAGIAATIMLLIGLDGEQRQLESGGGYGSSVLVLGAGLASGVAISAKPVGVPLLIVSLLWIWCYHRHSRLRHIFHYTLGAAIVPLAVLVWLAVGGVIGDMIEQFVVWNSHYALDRGAPLTWVARQAVLALFVFGPVLPLAATGGALMVGQRNAKKTWLLLWASAGVATVAMQPNPWAYHWFLALPPFCLLAANAIVNARRILESRPLFWVVGLSVVISAISVQAVAENARKSMLAVYAVCSGRSEKDFWGDFPNMGGTMGDTKEIASYLASHTSESDRLFTWMQTSAYIMAQRQPASKYTFLWPLVYGPAESRIRAQNELMSDLRFERPPYIVVPAESGWRWELPTVTLALDPFPELLDFVVSNYTLEAVIAKSEIYRLREEPGLSEDIASGVRLRRSPRNCAFQMQEE